MLKENTPTLSLVQPEIYLRNFILRARNKTPSSVKQLRSLREELKRDKRLNFKSNKQMKQSQGSFQVSCQGAFQLLTPSTET